MVGIKSISIYHEKFSEFQLSANLPHSYHSLIIDFFDACPIFSTHHHPRSCRF